MGDAENNNDLVEQDNLQIMALQNASSGNFKIAMLEGHNYSLWKVHMRNILKAKNLWIATQEGQVDQTVDSAAMATILSGLNEENGLTIINCETARSMWSELETLHEGRTSFEITTLLNRLTSFKIRGAREVAKSLGEMQLIASRLRLLGEPISDNILISAILGALPDNMKQVQIIWKSASVADRNISFLKSIIMSEVQEDTSLPKQDDDNRAFITKSKQTTRKGSCNYCGIPGHWARECRKRILAEGPSANPRSGPSNGQAPFHPNRELSRPQSNRQLARRPATPTNGGRPQQDFPNRALMMKGDTNASSRSEWIADTGCSLHLTCNREWLYDYKAFEKPVKFSMADGQISAIGVGKIQTDCGILHDVHLAPAAEDNLFSVSAAAKHGITGHFSGNDMVLIDRNGIEVCRAHVINGVYVMDMTVISPKYQAKVTSLRVWHDRMGHAPLDKIREMAKNQCVDELVVKDGQSFECITCRMVNLTRASHPTRTTKRTSVPGQIWHIDTAGPYNSSIMGSTYFVLAKDEASSYRYVMFVKSKDQIPGVVKQIIAQSKLDTQNDVLKIFTDGGTEFKSSLDEYLVSVGIIHERSARYTPAQNGYIERDIRTVKNTARALLSQANASNFLWAEAVNTAVYLLNRVTNTSDKTRTPYERFLGHKPRVGNLRSFGQLASVRTPDVAITNRWGHRGTLMQFVGYERLYNTYRFYDRTSRKVIVTCDASFLNEEKKYAEINSTVALNQPVAGAANPRGIPLIVDVDHDTGDSDQDNHNHRENPDEQQHPEAINPEGDDNIYEQIDRAAEEPTGDANNMPEAGSDHDFFDRFLEDRDEAQSPPGPSNPSAPVKKDKSPVQKMLSKLRDRKPISYRDARPYNAKAKLTRLTEAPANYREAISRPDRAKWEQAMDREIGALIENHVFEEHPRPKHASVVKTKWLFKLRRPKGKAAEEKARMVARGFTQIFGLNFFLTYAPVVAAICVRLLLAFAIAAGLFIKGFDVQTAFLNGDLDEEIFVEPPEGYEAGGNIVWRLRKSLYGLKQSPRQWNTKFKSFLQRLQLQQSAYDECVYYNRSTGIYLLLYVDDGLVIGHSEQVVDKFLLDLENEFKIHHVDVSQYLGFQIHRGEREAIIHQADYIEKLLNKFDMLDANEMKTPVSLAQAEYDDDEELSDEPYREAVGSLLYAVTTTRPDLAYGVSKASRKSSSPTQSDWRGIKRMFRYLKGSQTCGLPVKYEITSGLVVYCDADFGGDNDSRHSISGFVICFNGTPIIWKTKSQSHISLSSAEAELLAICAALRELQWIRDLCIELGLIDENHTVDVYSDSTSAIKIIEDEKSAHRTKHLSVKAAFVREMIERKEIKMKYVKGEDQVADFLTKPVGTAKFIKNRSVLMSFLAICLFVSLAEANGQQQQQMVHSSCAFTRALPIIWVPTNNYVIEGETTYEVTFTYLSPCDPIKEDQERQQARYKQFNPNTAPAELANEINVNQGLLGECQGLYSTGWVRFIDDWLARRPPSPPRKKRGITEMLTGVLMSTCVTNLLSTVNKYINPYSSYNRLNRVEDNASHLQKEVDEFRQRFNLTNQLLETTANNVRSLMKTQRDQQRQINHIVKLLPILTWRGAFIQTAIITSGADLKTIINEYEHGRVAVPEMAAMLNMTEFSHITNEDTIFHHVRRHDSMPNSIVLNFTVTNRSKDTHVFRVRPFKFWDKLTETPELKAYHGRTYLIYNSTSNCVKAIDEPAQLQVDEQCTTKDGIDEDLSLWRTEVKSEKPEEALNSTDFLTTKGFNYGYCFPFNITRENVECKCPPYVFKLSKTVSYATFDHSWHHANRVISKVQKHEKEVFDAVHVAHFRDLDTVDDETALYQALKRERENVARLQQQLEISVIVEKHGPVYWITIVVIIACVLLMIALSGLSYYNHARSIHSQQLLAAEMREIYGTGSVTTIETTSGGAAGASVTGASAKPMAQTRPLPSKPEAKAPAPVKA